MRVRINAKRLFPFISTVKNYSAEKAKADIIAGLSVAIVASPQSMAYAMIAGIDPVYGLYASIIPVVIAALWGSSNYHTAGPTNALAVVVYTSMAQTLIGGVALAAMPEEMKLSFLFMLAIITGCIQLLLGLTRLGDLANFISDSVLLGFTTGASLLIALGQVKNFFGLNFEAPLDSFSLLVKSVQALPQTNLYTLGISITTLLAGVSIKKFYPKLPNSLLALIFGTVVCTILGLESNGVLLSPEVPKGFLPFYFPNEEILLHTNSLLFPALAMAMLGSVSSVAIGRAMAGQKGEMFNSNQELIGQGLGNIASGFCCGMPGGGSFSRSAVNYMSGAKTRFSAAISGGFTLAMLLVFGPFVGYIPVASLAALLMLICWNMVDIKEILFIIKASKSDAVVFFATLLSVFIFSLEHAVFIGITLSLVLFLKKQSHPIFHPLQKDMIASEHYLFDCKKVQVYSLEGALFFGAVSDLEKFLKKFENKKDRVIILDMNGVNMIDASGVHAFQNFFYKATKEGVSIILCTTNPSVYTTFEKTGILEFSGIPITHSMKDAFKLAEEDLCCEKHCDNCKFLDNKVTTLPDL